MDVDDSETACIVELGRYELRPRRGAAATGGVFPLGNMAAAVASSANSSPKNSAFSTPYHASTWPRKSGRGRRNAKNEPLSFTALPNLVKQHIFSYLPQQERGISQRVCKEWRDELRRPTYWRTIDFTALPACFKHPSLPGQPSTDCDAQCFSEYVARVRDLVRFVGNRLFQIHQLRFEFDIRDSGADWRRQMEILIHSADTSQLRYLHMNWKLTAAYPCRFLRYDKYDNPNDINYRHRLRQRNFVTFFDKMLENCPRLRTLIVPFEWSLQSIESLTRLQHLHTLVLEKYHVFKTLSQETLDIFLKAVPGLRRLVLEVVTPGCREMCTYRMCHEQLRYLDVSQSRGFYIDTLDAPNLHTFKLARHPWNGPLVSADELDLPCVHSVLSRGTPFLEQLNELCLPQDWRVRPSQDLEAALRAVCSCRRHKHGWSM